ncbi:hypothetical protein [Paracerasibacillus soli]|uniref:Lipoprotein n=1 Tax=Paracerasibacillus soli TaxID=480284 RepID=A0ABU5CNV2_9BACI|nr:hypothetical protein [Virgibacillus soli]MDY0408037.1 hypothetical protein [Virgibacillus soli]
MFKRISLIFTLLLLVACTNSKPALQKVDQARNITEDKPTLVETEQDDELEEFIEFVLEDEVIRVNLTAVPILQQYLMGSKDRNKEIERMSIYPLFQENKDSVDSEDETFSEPVYLLEFSCYQSACSYLLLNQNQKNHAFLIADLATWENVQLSPKGSKVLLTFSREVKTQITNNIVVVDLMNWERLPLQNETNDLSLTPYKWVIPTVEWINDEQISVTIKDGPPNKTDESTTTSSEPFIHVTISFKKE